MKNEIEYRGITQRKLAKQMGISYTLLNEVLNCKRPVLTEYALLFEAALDIESEMHINMQADYNLQTIRQNKSWNERLANVRKTGRFALFSSANATFFVFSIYHLLLVCIMRYKKNVK